MHSSYLTNRDGMTWKASGVIVSNLSAQGRIRGQASNETLSTQDTKIFLSTKIEGLP